MKDKSNKMNILYGASGGIVGSALFAAATLGGQGITNAVTLIAGLGGGVISGFLTLQGVRQTIELQKEKELEDARPQHIVSIFKMINLKEEYRIKINSLRSKAIDFFLESGSEKDLKQLVKQSKEQHITVEQFRDGLIEESVKVDGNIYIVIKENMNQIFMQDKLLMFEILKGESTSKDNIKSKADRLLEHVTAIGECLDAEMKRYEQLMFQGENGSKKDRKIGG